MAIVEGQIETLKNLKEELNKNGITRFNSVGEINDFIKNYDSERNEIPNIIENALDAEIKELRHDLINSKQIYNDLKTEVLSEINHKILMLEEASKQAVEKSNKSLFKKILFYTKIKSLAYKKSNLENNLEKFLHKKTQSAEIILIEIKNKLDGYENNKEKIISDRCKQPYKEITSTKEVIEELYTLIAGAIGENATVKEIQKLSDNYFLINDFSIQFSPPIYNRKEDDKIFSIQIDHLLVCESGVFIIETKNWSKQSIKNIDLRSPVEQTLRTSYALFVMLNSDSEYNKIKLHKHHWGDKQIPIKNIIVMTNEKPNANFKHVKVLSLNELNGYIKYFDPIFNVTEVKNIFEYLIMKNN